MRNRPLWIGAAVVAVIVVYLVLAWSPTVPTPGPGTQYSDFVAAVDDGKVSFVTISGNEISGRYTDHGNFATYAPADPHLIERLLQHKVVIRAYPANESTPSLPSVIFSWLPYLLYLAVTWLIFARPLRRIALLLQQIEEKLPPRP